jgi:hypothetical protein
MTLATRTAVLIGVTATMLSLAGSARADDGGEGRHRFGQPGFVLTVDRLLPLLSYQSVKTNDEGVTTTDSRLSIAIVNNGPYGIFSTFYNLPRIGADWIPVRNLTIGGAGWFYTDLSATETTSNSTTTTQQPKVTYWGVAPRVGYIIPLGDKIYLWPRLGVEYHNVSTSDVGNGSGSITQFAFLAEAMVVISPWDHFGFQVGPTADIPISGTQTSTSAPTGMGGTTTTTTTTESSAMLQIGISAGVLGHF